GRRPGRGRLGRARGPLPAAVEPPAPPPGLVIGALARVAESRCRTLPAAPPPTPAQRLTPAARRMPRRADLLVAAALLIVLGGLGVLGVRQAWHVYHRTACANNLRALWIGLQNYAEAHHGLLPQVDREGPHSVAGIFVPVLRQAGVL